MTYTLTGNLGFVCRGNTYLYEQKVVFNYAWKLILYIDDIIFVTFHGNTFWRDRLIAAANL